MLPIFVQSLFLGATLTALALAARFLLRRTVGQRIRPLPLGEPLRCVRPLDPGQR
jgi:hypothetical protein